MAATAVKEIAQHKLMMGNFGHADIYINAMKRGMAISDI